jgi:hypothetical protein
VCTGETSRTGRRKLETFSQHKLFVLTSVMMMMMMIIQFNLLSSGLNMAGTVTSIMSPQR